MLCLSVVRQALGFLLLFSTISIVAWGGTFLSVSREMLRNVDARLMEQMDAAMASLDAGRNLPVYDPDETARFGMATNERGFAQRSQRAGISFQDRENALQPLHQGASTRQGEGFGLGLHTGAGTVRTGHHSHPRCDHTKP